MLEMHHALWESSIEIVRCEALGEDRHLERLDRRQAIEEVRGRHPGARERTDERGGVHGDVEATVLRFSLGSSHAPRLRGQTSVDRQNRTTGVGRFV